MIRKINFYISAFMILAIGMIMTGCLDDTFRDFDKEIGEGDADLRATVEFENLTPALDTRTAGNEIGAVSNLQMVIYKVVNGQTKFDRIVNCNQLDGYRLTSNGNSAEPGDKETGSSQTANGQFESTGETTDHADFTYPLLPYGRYKIYAVANVPGLTKADCETEEKLKEMSFTWNESNIGANNAMFGYFTRADNQSSSGFEAPIIIVNSHTLDIHAWIKRLVSKVTVAFDPSELKEAVTVYIKDVTIHDIPRTCYLGQDNKPSDMADLITNGESIKYYDAATENDYKKWGIVLQKGSGKKGSKHENNDPNSLFFFENMQGNYEGQKPYLKVQIPEETGTSVDNPTYNSDGSIKNDFKDRVPYGTYIEVNAYYVSKNTEKMSSGNIKYRFMLGKNITYNYDAQRNYHYKLTLKLRGFANEADWHVSYKEPTPSVYTPDQYYISYLYGQELGYPVRIITGDSENTERYTLKAEIIENPWWPYDEDLGGYPNIYVGKADNFDAFAWMKSAVEPGVSEGVLSKPYYVGDYRNFAGFLSLRQPEKKNGKYEDIEFPEVVETGNFAGRSYGPKHNDALKTYYTTHNVGSASYTLATGTRTVALYNGQAGSSEDGQYTVTRDKDGSVTLRIPMYTRPKKMVAGSDFTGNNPYGSYMRRALVRFTLLNEKGETVKFKDLANNEKEVEYRDVPIFQVRRIENPKAIYRAWNNTESFDVKLMHLRDVNPTTPPNEFTTFTSDGPWRASILETTEDFVKLTTTDGQTVTKKGQYIHGSTGDPIEFTYQPTGKCASSSSARCALILVEYHDYTCNHLIFVRQGYDDEMTYLGNAYWSCYQVYATKGVRTDYQPENLTDCDVIVTRSPLSMGSLLKRCQYNYSFREADNPGWLKQVGYEGPDGNTYNTEKELFYTVIKTENGKKVADNSNSNKVSWGSVQGYAWRNYDGDQIRYNIGWADTWTAVDYQAGKKLTVPTREQFEQLRDKCDFGFGIAYGDGATETATSLDDAYKYLDSENTGKTSKKGVRACIAYDSKTAWNILFPLGIDANGRRCATGATHINGTPAELGLPKRGSGTVSYGGMSTVLYQQSTTYRPITYNHYRTPGAIYWTKIPYYAGGDKLKAYASWDINYFTLTFNKYSEASIAGFTGGGTKNWTSSDALPIKLIYNKSN